MKIPKPLLGLVLLINLIANAQLKIGDNATTISSGSLLELESSSKGIVFPRISLTNTNSVLPLPATLLSGTIVFNTNESLLNGNGVGLYFWNGILWIPVTPNISLSAWSLNGNSGTSPSNFIGTTDAADFISKTNNIERMRILGAANGSSKAGWIGMGISVPRSSLDVTGNYTNKNVLTLQNTSNSGYSSVDMMDDAGNLKGTFGYANSGTGTFFSGKDYFNNYNNDFVFTNNSGNYNFFIKGSTGNIGINTSTPAATIDVDGTFKLGSSGTVLTNMIKGTASITSFSITGIGTTITKTLTVTGANVGASVTVNPQNSLPPGALIAYSYVSALNTITIGFLSTLSSIAFPSTTFTITVIQ